MDINYYNNYYKKAKAYKEMVDYSLCFLSKSFGIEGLADNKLVNGKDYITVDEDTDTMVIQSLFNKYNEYVIPRVSTVSLYDKIGIVDAEEIKYLKDKFTWIGKFYMQPNFGEDYEINFDVNRGSFCVIVKVRDPFVTDRPLCRKFTTSLMILANRDNITSMAHEVFEGIRNELLDRLNKEKVVAGKIEDQLSSFYGMSGGDFDGDVLYKEMSKLQLNSIYGLRGGDILANGDLTKRVKELRAAIYRDFGVPESMVDTKESTAAYEHAMDAIISTFDKHKGGFMKDYTSMYGKAIKKVIFNDPATIVMWNDGTKTVVKKHGDVEFNGEAAVMYAYVLRWHFNNNRKSMRIWLKQNAKRFEWQSEEPKKITVTRTSKGKITKASQREIYDAMTPEQKEVVDAIIKDAVKEFKKGGKNEDIR